MDVRTADTLAGILDKVNFYRFEDKSLKVVLTRNFVALRRVAKQAVADQSELVKKFQSDWKDEIEEVQALRDKGEPIVGHEAYLTAEADGVEAITGIFDAEVDITLEPVALDAFVKELNGEVTPEQVAILEENGLLI